MIPFFPKQISQRGVIVYLIILTFVSLFFIDYAMDLFHIVLGVVSVSSFFFFSSFLSQRGMDISEKSFVGYVFAGSLALRIVWVIASYFYYIEVTGIPFEVDTADALAYHEDAKWLACVSWDTVWGYLFRSGGVSDVGYPLFLTGVYRLFGPAIIIPRILQALLSAWMCILSYRLCSRTFGEPVGRMAGIMCAFMPNLIIYCGYHLKETEMLFLSVAFLERTDYLLRVQKYNLWNILFPLLLAGSLFFFRTVLGAAAVFAFVTSVLLSNAPAMRKGWKRLAIIGWSVLAVLVTTGGTAMTEIEGYWEQKETNVIDKRMAQTISGNKWAKYATGTVMAPMAFALPFATMVDVDNQVAQQTKSGGNYIRNFMAFFALLAIFEAFRQKKWRNFVLIGAFVIAYLGVVSMSGFSNSERFLLPGLPCLIAMWAYGVSELRAPTYKFLTPWCVVVFLMEFGWAFFKLGSRGLF